MLWRATGRIGAPISGNEWQKLFGRPHADQNMLAFRHRRHYLFDAMRGSSIQNASTPPLKPLEITGLMDSLLRPPLQHPT